MYAGVPLMCGVAGFTNLDGAPADAGVLAAMTDAVRHRGPDDRGELRVSVRGGTPDTGFGFQRLNILDPTERGRQPFANADGSIVLMLNGEIYNAFEHRRVLEQHGYRFRSHTDTEVVLALYERDGLDAMLDRLNGMFALAIADCRQRLVHLVRDPLGIKPLYWTQCGQSVLFASEAKAFLAHPAFRAEIDADQVDELLAFRYVAGAQTLLKGVRQVLPGHRITVSARGIADACYWSIPDPADVSPVTFSTAVDQLDERLRRSVAMQMRSDVRVGCQLSGGIDSSLVTAYASAHANHAIETCSVVFDDVMFSERTWIDTAAGVARAANHRTSFGADAFVAALDQASWYMDQPISHPNTVALWQLGRDARTRATVLLTGEGADELFGGYARFAAAARAAAVDRADAFVRATQFHPEARLRRLRPDADLQPALERRRQLFDEGRGDHLSNCVRYELRTHLPDVLMRQDKMMMAHGIENRVPFLDRDLVEFARRLPTEYLVAKDDAGVPRTKAIVKTLATRMFPAAFVDRRKAGFNLPLAQYFRSRPFIELMEDRLLPGMASRGLVDVEVVRRWWRRALSAPKTTEGFWIPVALELWAQQWRRDVL